MSEGERRLAAIMYTDIVGYTFLSQKNEALAMQLLEEHRKLVRPLFLKHNGREVKTIGDAFLVEFASALEAVRCAFDMQQSVKEMNNGRMPEKQVQIRIGIHLGDVIHDQNDVYGDAINVASRIEPLAMPGGICVSQQVYDHIKNKFEFSLTSIGKRELKNLGEPTEVFRVVLPWGQAATVGTPTPDRVLATILYIDIVESTRRLSTAGDARWRELLSTFKDVVRKEFARFGGKEVKFTGDGFLATFDGPTRAIKCAEAIREGVARLGVETRMGLHTGEFQMMGDDIAGIAVHAASRIMDEAEAGQILVSSTVKDLVAGSGLELGDGGIHALKGLQGEWHLFMVPLHTHTLLGQMTEAERLPRHRIAILPFRNMSPDPKDEYFAEGMTEEIISTVSGISGLNVISRTSVMQYKKTDKTVKQIGRELEVGSVLEGSFRKAGNRIRVTTQLIDVAGDRHLWVQNYDRDLDDVFEVQSDVAKQVSEALRVRILSPEKERIEKKPTDSTAAYTLYLKGRYLWNKRGLDDLRKARECFESAVKEDPSFALGYVGQADCAVVLRSNLNIDPEENLAKAKAMAVRALQLDPALAEAHATLGMVCESEYDLCRAEEELRRAIELKPSYTTAHQWYSTLLREELRWGEALEHIETAVELDPLSGIIAYNLGYYYSSRRDFNKAVEKFRIAAELGYESYVHSNLQLAYGMMKMYDQMEKEGEAFERYFRDTFPCIRTSIDAYSAYCKGDKETVRRLLPELEAHPKETYMTAHGIARFYFFLDDADKGFEWLERAYSKKEGGLLEIQLDWDLDEVRADPRYLDLLKRLGLG